MKQGIIALMLATVVGCGGAPAKKPDPTPAGTPNAAPAATTTPDAAKGHGQSLPANAPAPGAPATPATK